jgi:hypothetical protein
VLGTLRRIGLDRLLPRRPERLAKLALALIVARVIEPAAKLATARQLSEATASHSLGAVLGLGEVGEDELYRVLDVLGAAQPAIERALARRHLEDGTLVLYDVTSSYLESRCCELARFGYSRDDRPEIRCDDRPQIVFGLLCAADGCPVAVEVFEGDTGDPKTLAAQIDKLKKRFGLKRVVLVGDRGMITSEQVRNATPAGPPQRRPVHPPRLDPIHGYYHGYSIPGPDVAHRLTWIILKAHTGNRAGTVQLRSADPRDTPLINFRYFEEGTDRAGDDLSSIVDGIEYARRINARLADISNGDVWPGPQVQSRDDLTRFVRDEAWGHHASAPAKSARRRTRWRWSTANSACTARATARR